MMFSIFAVLVLGLSLWGTLHYEKIWLFISGFAAFIALTGLKVHFEKKDHEQVMQLCFTEWFGQTGTPPKKWEQALASRLEENVHMSISPDKMACPRATPLQITLRNTGPADLSASLYVNVFNAGYDDNHASWWKNGNISVHLPAGAVHQACIAEPILSDPVPQNARLYGLTGTFKVQGKAKGVSFDKTIRSSEKLASLVNAAQ